MGNQLILSFILPFYNVEEYICGCLDSIYALGLNETDFEILCINDCTPDNSRAKIEEYAADHTNIKIIDHEINMGLGGARNTGIKCAKGKYLWFIDTDDRVARVDLKRILRLCNENCLDVLAFNYQRVDSRNMPLPTLKVFPDYLNAVTGIEYIKDVFGTHIVNHIGYVWRFIYRSEYLKQNNLYFPEHIAWEDTVFVPKSIIRAGRINSVSDIGYLYKVNQTSISGGYHNSYRAELIYQFAFVTGDELLLFSNEIDDLELRKAFYKKAIDTYINGFMIPLLRCSFKEKKRFYKIISLNKAYVETLLPYISQLNKLLLMKYIGFLVVLLLTFFYRIKHN